MCLRPRRVLSDYFLILSRAAPLQVKLLRQPAAELQLNLPPLKVILENRFDAEGENESPACLCCGAPSPHGYQQLLRKKDQICEHVKHCRTGLEIKFRAENISNMKSFGWKFALVTVACFQIDCFRL